MKTHTAPWDYARPFVDPLTHATREVLIERGWIDPLWKADRRADKALSDGDYGLYAEIMQAREIVLAYARGIAQKEMAAATLDEMELHECACNGATIDRPGCTCGRESDPDAELPH